MNEKTENYELVEGILIWINPKLKEFTVPEGVEKIKLAHICNSMLERIEFSSTVKWINCYGLGDLKNLKEVKSNEGLEFIENRTFIRSGINSIELPSTVRNVGVYAFYGCKNLQKVIINGDFTYFGTYAFNRCDELKELTVPMSNNSASSLKNAFKNHNGIEILNYNYLGIEKDIFDSSIYFPNFKKSQFKF